MSNTNPIPSNEFPHIGLDFIPEDISKIPGLRLGGESGFNMNLHFSFAQKIINDLINHFEPDVEENFRAIGFDLAYIIERLKEISDYRKIPSVESCLEGVNTEIAFESDPCVLGNGEHAIHSILAIFNPDEETELDIDVLFTPDWSISFLSFNNTEHQELNIGGVPKVYSNSVKAREDFLAEIIVTENLGKIPLDAVGKVLDAECRIFNYDSINRELIIVQKEAKKKEGDPPMVYEELAIYEGADTKCFTAVFCDE